jgi:hypothetical protein
LQSIMLLLKEQEMKLWSRNCPFLATMSFRPTISRVPMR